MRDVRVRRVADRASPRQQPRPRARAEALAEARDNVRFAAPDEANGLAEPDGVAPAQLDLLRPDSRTVPTADKVALALELERRATSLDPRIRSVPQRRVRRLPRDLGAGHEHRAARRRVLIHLLRHGAGPGGRGDANPDRRRLLGRAVVGRPRPRRRSRKGGRPAVRMLGARQPPTQRTTVVLEPEVTASFLGIVGSTLAGRRC
jgi:PmbA protein